MYSSLRFFLSLTNDSFFFIQNRPKCYSVFITQQQLNENIAVTFQPFCGNKKHRRWEEKNKSIIKKILSVGSPVFGQGTRNLRLCRFIFSCVPAWGLKSSCQSILLMMFKEYISATAEFLIIRQVSMAENAGIFPRENELPVCSSVLTLSSPPRTRECYRVPQAVTELLTGLGPVGPAPVTPAAGGGPATLPDGWGTRTPCPAGAGAEPRAELGLSKHIHPWISDSQRGRVTSCVTHWIRCSYGQQFS